MQGNKRSLFLGQAQFEEAAQPPNFGMGLHEIPPGMSRLQAGSGQPPANVLLPGGRKPLWLCGSISRGFEYTHFNMEPCSRRHVHQGIEPEQIDLAAH